MEEMRGHFRVNLYSDSKCNINLDVVKNHFSLIFFFFFVGSLSVGDNLTDKGYIDLNQTPDVCFN